MSSEPASVLVLDDHAGARQWLLAAVREAFPAALCHSAATLAEARRALGSTRFGLALIDLQLPDGQGLSLLPELLAPPHPALCVIATIYDDDDHLFSALKAGAQGYLLKEQACDQLASRLRAAVQGQPLLSPGIARRLLAHFSRLPTSPAAPPASHPLTPREREVLTLIGKGYSVTDAAQALSLSRHTAHDHVRAIYRKLEISSRAEAAIAARDFGLC